MTRIGALFAGYGGLELGVQAVIGGSVAWHAEIDPAASRVLAHHWPDVPNHGDITKVDWRDVEPVDVLTGGFPCQDVSHAGKRAGLGPGTRSGLWSEMHRAIQVLRPSLVVAENVRGLLSAGADSDVESCAWCVGDGEGEPPLRALGAVLGSLADIGYDAAWAGLRAADVGAPHGRFRVFIVAWPAEDADDATSGQWRQPASRQAEGMRARADPGRRGRAPAGDAGGERHGRGQDPQAWGRVDGADAGPAWERERSRGVPGDRSATPPPHTDLAAGSGAHERVGPGDVETRPRPGGPRMEAEPRETAQPVDFAPANWAAYGPAIARWERVTGRPAPAPTGPGPKGSPRLAPAFVEWMMGLPAGHVTAVPGITRNDQLKALGNGVVWQQAAAAVAHLLGVIAADDRAAS